METEGEFLKDGQAGGLLAALDEPQIAHGNRTKVGQLLQRQIPRDPRGARHNFKRTTALEIQLQRQLDQPGRGERRDFAERGTGDVRARVVPVGVIQDVEELATQLELPTLAHCEPPAQRHVEIDLARAIDGVPAQVAEQTGVYGACGVRPRTLECRRIEPVRRVVRRDCMYRGGRYHPGAVQAPAGQGNVLAAIGDLDWVAGEDADIR